ncbi:hypothetical protein BCH308197_A0077 (plasmid) [Bacillus cereus H3081.97]|uniref:Uncharacterized protein n=1 Tax=Bacillus cereus (strain AH187) TaxID=405534 RepID=B7I1F3_BACC7|nr:hypothetical protein BCH308197_A0077 [Bacillus cereus H3081.97]ACJ82612.1 hypothetical protein BCAH187_C0184 [Bacillus cereus AH187]
MMQLILYIEKALARARGQFLCGSKKENHVHRTVYILTSILND